MPYIGLYVSAMSQNLTLQKCVKGTFLGIGILNKNCFIGFFAAPFFWLDILVSEMVVSENAGLCLEHF